MMKKWEECENREEKKINGMNREKKHEIRRNKGERGKWGMGVYKGKRRGLSF